MPDNWKSLDTALGEIARLQRLSLDLANDLRAVLMWAGGSNPYGDNEPSRKAGYNRAICAAYETLSRADKVL
jgi:hypothetical protein